MILNFKSIPKLSILVTSLSFVFSLILLPPRMPQRFKTFLYPSLFVLAVFALGLKTYVGAADEPVKRYNIRLGSVLLDLTGTFGLEYNDNITLAEDGAKKDVILRPGVILNTEYRASEINTLSLSLGMNYAKYLKHKELNTASNAWNVDRASNLKYKVKLRSYTLTLSDYFNFSTDPTDAVSVDPNTGTVDRKISVYSRFNNKARLDIDHKEKNFSYNLAFSRMDLIPLDAKFKFLRRVEYNEMLSVQYTASPALIPGIQGGLFQNQYRQGFQNDSYGHTIGPTLEWRITPLVYMVASASYGTTHFKSTGANQDISGNKQKVFSTNLQLNHRMNRYYSHAIRFSRMTNFGSISNTTEVRTLEYTFSWRATKRITYEGNFSFEKGKDSGGISPEDYTRYISGLKFARRFNKHATAFFEAYYGKKKSNKADGGYTVKRLIVSLNYDF